jgi:hypothetical protein
MNQHGSSKNVTKIRLMAAPEMANALAGQIVALLETTGFEVLEWSMPQPCREPDLDKNRIYLTAVKKGAENGTGPVVA